MAIHLTFSIQDEKGDVSTIDIPVPDSTPLTDIPYLLQAFADLLDPIVQGGLVQAAAKVIGTVTGWGSAAAAGSDVQEKASFLFRTAGGYAKKIGIPTILESIFNAGSKDVDLGHTDVAALVTAIETGVDVSGAGGSGVIQPCDYRGDDISDLETATEDWGKRRS
jgi:hypothetical protein